MDFYPYFSSHCSASFFFFSCFFEKILRILVFPIDPSQNTTNNINTNINNLETATQNEITNTTPNEIEEPQEAIPSPEVEIASFSTPLKSKANGRRHNIELTASILDGTIIGPGETFSFNQVVGKPSSARGYEEADVLVDGETTQAIGGR